TMWAERASKSIDHRLDEWIREQRGLAGRLPRRYASIEDAFRRMQEENPHLSAEQARHLTVHGVNQNEDGTYSWKFDNYVRVFPPYDMRGQDIKHLWSRIACPTLLLYGIDRRCASPAGRAARATGRRMGAPNRSATPPWSASSVPATGCTTTASMSSCAWSATSSRPSRPPEPLALPSPQRGEGWSTAEAAPRTAPPPPRSLAASLPG